MHRPEDMLRERLPIGPPELFAEKLAAFAKAGVQRVYIWPVADEVRQLAGGGDDPRKAAQLAVFLASDAAAGATTTRTSALLEEILLPSSA